MNVAALRTELAARGLDTSGLKPALVGRLRDAIGEAANGEGDEAAAAPAAPAGKYKWMPGTGELLRRPLRVQDGRGGCDRTSWHTLRCPGGSGAPRRPTRVFRDRTPHIRLICMRGCTREDARVATAAPGGRATLPKRAGRIVQLQGRTGQRHGHTGHDLQVLARYLGKYPRREVVRTRAYYGACFGLLWSLQIIQALSLAHKLTPLSIL
jgi:hypothetical protein